MRKLNSLFLTNFISESGTEAKNKTYYGFVELDSFYCLAISEGYDTDEAADSAKLCIDTVISLFVEKPTIISWRLSQYVKKAHEELKLRSVKTQLKASLLLIVSDYSRVRYVQCGNIMCYLLRENHLVMQSNTHTLYQSMKDDKLIPDDGITGLEHASNITVFLGSRERITITVSPALMLKEEDFLLVGTHSFWSKVSPVELLDADEGRTETQVFLQSLEELFLSGQSGAVSSYCMASVHVKKVYREDITRSRKWIKRLIIIALAAVIVITAIITAAVQIDKKNKRLQGEITNRVFNYNSSGDLYFGAESYEAAVQQYEKALEEVPKLRDEKLKLKQEQDLIQKLSMITDLQKAETATAAKDFNLSKKLFLKVRESLGSYPELGLDSQISKNLVLINRQIEIMNLKDYAKLVEGAEDYGTARDTYNRIYEMQRILEDFDGMKETRLAIFDLDQTAKEGEKVLESQQEDKKQAANQQEIQEITSKGRTAEQAVIDKDLKRALEIYRGMREELLVLGAKEEADKVYNTILTLEEQLKKEESEQKAKALEEEIKQIDAKKLLAEQALLDGKKEEARRIYKEMSDSYIKFGEIEKASEIYQILLGL